MLSIIVASAKNRVIGRSNDLPWYLPADLRHFKHITLGHPVIMGRKTFDAIMARLGKPLPGRQNIVLTTDPTFQAAGVSVVHTLDEAIATAQNHDAFIIGGATVYEQALSKVRRIYMTEVRADMAGDTYFPALDMSQWREVSRESHKADEKNQYDYAFVLLERI